MTSELREYLWMTRLQLYHPEEIEPNYYLSLWFRMPIEETKWLCRVAEKWTDEQVNAMAGAHWASSLVDGDGDCD